MKKYEKIRKMMERGCQILGSDYAILGGAMTWISEANLVSTMSNAGMFGVLASGAMDGDLLKNEITLTQSKTKRNFGVNIILMNPKLPDLIDVCGEKKISHVILAGGIPDKDLMDKIHSYGMQVFSFAPSLSIAKRLFRYGIDAIILEGSEAGGHVGPISTTVLLQDIMLNINEYPVFVAGGILRGEIFASMLLLGAVGCQLGTVFACAKESIAHENFKKALLRANAKDAVTPVQLDKKFPVAPVRAIENLGTTEFMAKQKEILRQFENHEVSLEEGRLLLEHFWVGALRRAVQNGDVERGSLMSGQIVGVVKEEKSISEIMSTLLTEAENFLDKNKIC
ncbi:MAG: nitronate monooxygenase [Holosporaceae bacterium]|jgi:enoyl-[acyl-carrier protein] reductase II|nr:nitronate monooxygenase [Holosporaceae bacterium]